MLHGDVGCSDGKLGMVKVLLLLNRPPSLSIQANGAEDGSLVLWSVRNRSPFPSYAVKAMKGKF